MEHGARTAGTGGVPDRVGPVFAALADPHRRYVVETLVERGSTTATELAARLPVTRQAVAKHLAALRAAGLVSAERSGRETRYALTPAPLDEAAGWLERVGTEWDERLAALSRHLANS
jgi:ArsR family transcriptional regulator, cadmium/lead-responsive transcriptional repressor